MPRGKGKRGMHVSQQRSQQRRDFCSSSSTQHVDSGWMEDGFTDTRSPSNNHVPTQGTPPPSSAASALVETSGTLPLAYVAYGRLMPQQVSGQITKIFKSNMCKDAFNWKLIPSSHKNGYFDDFKKIYRWPQEEETTIKNAFMKLGRIRYSDMVSNFKKNWNGPQKKKPDCIGEADWAQWVQHFNKDEVKRKSEINSKNRLTEKEDGCSKHTGGSKSAVAHLESMKKENQGIPPSLFKLQLRTHVRKDGTYVDNHARKICEDYQREIEVASSERELTVEEEDKIYLRVAGVKKQRVYGLGSVGSSLASDDGTSKGSNTQMVEDNLTDFKSEMIEKLNEEKKCREEMEKKHAQERKGLEEKIEELEQHRAELDKKLQIIMDSMGHRS